MKKQRWMVSAAALVMAVMMMLTACTSGQTSHVRIDDPNSSSREQSDNSSRPSGKEDAKNESDAKKVIQMIDAIGTVTLASESVINRARNAYDVLSDGAKALVTNYQTLVAAETKLADLKAAADSEALSAQADAVVSMIAALYPITVNSEIPINEARAAYDALPEDAKALVTNYQALLDAEALLPYVLEAYPVINLIDAIGTVTLDSESAISAARSAYEALSTEAKNQVTNYQTLLDAEAALQALLDSSVSEAEADALFSITTFSWDWYEDGYYIFLEYTNKSSKTITDLEFEVGFTDDDQNPIIMDGFTSERLILVDHDDLAPGQTSSDEESWGPVTCGSQEPTWIFIYAVEIFYTDGTSVMIDGDAIYGVCDWN